MQSSSRLRRQPGRNSRTERFISGRRARGTALSRGPPASFADREGGPSSHACRASRRTAEVFSFACERIGATFSSDLMCSCRTSENVATQKDEKKKNLAPVLAALRAV